MASHTLPTERAPWPRLRPGRIALGLAINAAGAAVIATQLISSAALTG